MSRPTRHKKRIGCYEVGPMMVAERWLKEKICLTAAIAGRTANAGQTKGTVSIFRARYEKMDYSATRLKRGTH